MVSSIAITSIELPNGIRSQSTTSTLAWLNTLLPALGISRVANITGLDRIGIPVISCIRPNAKHMCVSAGKGLTVEQAKISAIMEAAETWHVENPPPIIFTTSFLESSDHFISPTLFQKGYWQAKNIDAVNMPWVLAKDLRNHHTVYIPHILVNMNSLKANPLAGLLHISSNGLAAGNTLDEAYCHALYELIERDLLAAWSQIASQKRRQKLIDLRTIDDKEISDILVILAQAGIHTHLWDISFDKGICGFHCALLDKNNLSPISIATGSGAHAFKKTALLKALLEAIQTRAVIISGMRDDIFPHFYQRLPRLSSADFYSGTLNYAALTEKILPSNITDHKYALFKHIPGVLYSVNHTNAKFNIPVVQVFAPELAYRIRRT